MLEEAPPIVDEARLACKCGHEWTGYLLSWVSPDTWIAHVKALRCPGCGAGYKALRMGPERSA